MMVATVVSRSRNNHGQYGATFQMEKIIHVGISEMKICLREALKKLKGCKFSIRVGFGQYILLNALYVKQAFFFCDF